ncbi:L,D-transpeptidase family protein [Fulvivirgaceae bacterium BMA10]|uniref:L,D-transpeptidase family protein n=1 Tax=Splendidivirga corallicola TaxID=3051826 RepID=A0ABT8KI76_9BACT|nr:L,D-transpeptidase family protein [Fulvivirgaceae bacterium BMA10]
MTKENDFRKEQLKYPRVRAAYQHNKEGLKELLAKRNISNFRIDLFIRAFKKEELLEVWVKQKGDDKYLHLMDFPFCESSGALGPKRKEGDFQIPEGFYHIDRFNPSSNFHLSLGLNYPNKSDRIKGDKANPGSNIFIHGGCATIGCIPITDEKIKSLYILAVEAKTNGQTNIPVHIFPSHLDKISYDKLKANNGRHDPFWKNLKAGYDYFAREHIVPQIGVNHAGDYIISND